MRRQYWTKIEIERLKQIYPVATRGQIMAAFSNRTNHSILKRAAKLGLKRSRWTYRNGDLAHLLQDTPETLYWIGYLLADGHFTHGRIEFRLGNEDAEQVQKYAKFIGSRVYKCGPKNSGTATMDKKTFALIVKKFDLSSRKTYIAPNLASYNLSDDLWISLICGYIDGDGHIGHASRSPTGAFIRFTAYRTWLKNFECIKNRLETIFSISAGHSKIRNDGYAVYTISRQSILMKLKERAISMGLPLLKRKWDTIILGVEYRYERAHRRREIIKRLLQKGVSQREIARQLNMAPSSITKAIQVHNLRSVKIKALT